MAPPIISKLGDTLHEYMILGSLGKDDTWGGEVCASNVPLSIRIIETSVWIVLMVWIFYYFQFYQKLKTLKKDIESSNQSLIAGWFDYVLAIVAFANYIVIMIYKAKLGSLIYMLQPCHIVTLVQAIALFSNTPLGVMLSLLSLPITVGSGGAMMFPATSGLDFYLEFEMFWIQHIVIQILPLYMLMKNNSLTAHLFDMKTLMIGNWILVMTHWVVFEPIDLIFNVNINFFLCPAHGMQMAFDTMVPSILLLPTYRSFLMWIFVVLSFPTCYIYVYSAKVISSLINSSNSKEDDKIK